MLDVVSRSQRGRVCEYRRGDGCVRTPTVLRSDSDGPCRIFMTEGGRVLNFMGSEISLDPPLLTSASSGTSCMPMVRDNVAVMRFPVTGDEAIPDDVEVVVAPNGFEIKGDFRKLVDQIMKLRTAAGFGRLVCVLGVSEPSNVALLAYMGVDVFDDSFCRAAGLNGVSLIPEGNVVAGDDCSEKNVEELEREVSKIAVFTGAGRLRELVDQRSFSSAEWVAALRIFDADGYDYQEETCSLTGWR